MSSGTSTTRTPPRRDTWSVPRSARRSSAFFVVPHTSAASERVRVRGFVMNCGFSIGGSHPSRCPCPPVTT